MTPATPLISSARIIPIYPPGPRPSPHPPEAWRVRVEWWGERQGMDMDYPTEAEARWWLALVEATQPTPRELLRLGWGFWGVASHGGVQRPKEGTRPVEQI